MIVPNYLSEEIYKKVDAQLEICPNLKPHREDIYNKILRYFDEHGVIPDFSLEEIK